MSVNRKDIPVISSFFDILVEITASDRALNKVKNWSTEAFPI